MTKKLHESAAAGMKRFQCSMNYYGVTVVIDAADAAEAEREYLRRLNVISTEWQPKIEELTEEV